MKKLVYLLFLYLFFLSMPGLYAQINQDAQFYVLPVTGAGTREAKRFIYDKLNYEVAFNNYPLLSARRGSDYVIRGTIHSVIESAGSQLTPSSSGATPRIRSTGERREFLSWEVRNSASFYDTSSNRNSDVYRTEYVLILRLMSSRTNDIIDERHLVFNDLNDNLNIGISLIMNDFFAGNPPPRFYDVDYIPPYIAERSTEPLAFVLPEPEPEPEPEDRGRLVFSDDWRDKVFYFEYSLLWAPRLSAITNDWIYFNIGQVFAFEWQIFRFFGIELGLQFVQEPSGGQQNLDVILEFPASAKIYLKPFNNLMINMYGGASLNYISFTGKVEPSLWSYFGGLEICFNTSAGIFVIEPRVTRDFEYTNLGPPAGYYKRTMVQLGIGIKFGILSRLVRVYDDE